MTPETIFELLSATPDSIFICDIELAKVGAHLAELQDSFEIAELNAELGVELPAKSNEDTRKQLRAEAVSKSPDAKHIKSMIQAEKIRQAEKEAERSKYTRTFSAALAMAELAAAQLNAIAAKTRKEIVIHEH